MNLDWGESSGVGEAVAFGGAHGLILAPERLSPRTQVAISGSTPLKARVYSVSGCGSQEARGRFKLALKVVNQ